MKAEKVISGNLEFLLRKYLEKHPIGELYDAPFDVYLTEHNVFQPDKAFISKDRLSILTDAGAEGAPDFIVEILSDSTERFDKTLEKKVYASAGVIELWFIDPAKKTIEVYFLQKDVNKPAAVHRKTDRFTSPTFPKLTIEAKEIFGK